MFGEGKGQLLWPLIIAIGERSTSLSRAGDSGLWSNGSRWENGSLIPILLDLSSELCPFSGLLEWGTPLSMEIERMDGWILYRGITLAMMKVEKFLCGVRNFTKV